jgi:cytoskeleton protein RodZ
MDELGHILREAREMKGLTLADVQDKIRINSRFLQALEDGDYTVLPTAVHARGFLRNYARFLDLDPRPLLERFESSLQQMPYPSNAAESTPALGTRTDQTFFNPVNVDLTGGTVGGPERNVRLVIILALLVTIGLAASRFVPLLRGQGDGRDNLPALIESLLATSEPEPALDDEGLPLEAPVDAIMPEVTSQPILPTERNNPEAPDTAAGASASPPARPALPVTMDSIHLRLDITERTWIRVTIDGEVALEDMVTREDSPLEWDASSEAHLLTGNAAGVFVTINDIEIGRLGGRGEAAEERWSTTGN